MGDGTKIAVTPAVIDEARREDSANCMVAEGIKCAFPGVKRVHVDLQTIRFTDRDGNRRTYLTPGRAQIGIVAFDAGDEVEPFTFALKAPIHVRPKRNGAKTGRILNRVEAVGRSQIITTRSGERPDGITVVSTRSPRMTGATRRRYGIRGLRINQDGRVVQEPGL